ncbi:hypothetical protein L486_00320 [Kwoniella mangroviensis CBS 10435]|uniref:Uncharacterized protein n=1 Tax=Kwoniella mangroviensis CBS 10435 TaxID=1331196 RepID=A0A1B9IZ43_9TREE|nr:hypothetical protein L486_00320 [Kwoniella mangroviensis CBS 10435]
MKILWDACAIDISGSGRLFLINQLSPVIASRKDGNFPWAAHGQFLRLMIVHFLESRWPRLVSLVPSFGKFDEPLKLVKIKRETGPGYTADTKRSFEVASNFTKDLPLLIGALSLVPAHHEVLRMCFAALASLVPWSSDRSLMTYEQARDTGLAAMEETIFLTIAEVSIAMCKKVDTFPEALGDLVDTALEIYKWLPFTSYGGMIRWIEMLEEAMVRWPNLYKYDPIRSVLPTIRNQKQF